MLRNLRAGDDIIVLPADKENATVVFTAKPSKYNLLAGELNMLRNLRMNDGILILPADKGNVTVGTNTVIYQQKNPRTNGPDDVFHNDKRSDSFTCKKDG